MKLSVFNEVNLVTYFRKTRTNHEEEETAQVWSAKSDDCKRKISSRYKYLLWCYVGKRPELRPDEKLAAIIKAEKSVFPLFEVPLEVYQQIERDNGIIDWSKDPDEWVKRREQVFGKWSADRDMHFSNNPGIITKAQELANLADEVDSDENPMNRTVYA